MVILQNFALAALVSLIGSLQPGYVNLGVAHTAVRKSTRSGLWMAAGGSLPEAFYAGLALWGAGRLGVYPGLLQALQLLLIPSLLAAGIYYLVKPAALPFKENQAFSFDFFRGLILGFFNPLLLTFWLGAFVLLESGSWISTAAFSDQWALILGASFGAFVLLGMVAGFTGSRRKQLPASFLPYADKITGAAFLLFAIAELVKAAPAWFRFFI